MFTSSYVNTSASLGERDRKVDLPKSELPKKRVEGVAPPHATPLGMYVAKCSAYCLRTVELLRMNAATLSWESKGLLMNGTLCGRKESDFAILRASL